MSTELYYQHSGKYDAGGLLTALLGGIAAAVILSFAYAYLLLYIPLAGYVTLLLTGGYGFLLGLVMAFLMKRGKVRNPGAAVGVTLLVSLVGLYSSWAVWVYAFLRRAEVDVDLVSVFLQPGALWNAISLINADGAWTIRNWSPTGGTLWFFWGLEAVIILGAACLVLYGAITKDPFCEGCGTWCEETEGVARLGQTDGAELKQHLESRDFAYLEKLGPAKADAPGYVEINVHSCPNCRGTHTVSANLVTVTVNKKGESEANKETVADKLNVDSSGADAIRTIGQKLAAAGGLAAAK
jgi:hypothetical protein